MKNGGVFGAVCVQVVGKIGRKCELLKRELVSEEENKLEKLGKEIPKEA